MSSELVSIQKLTDGFSNQSKMANHNWLALASVSIIVLISTTSNELPKTSDMVNMPLSLGTVYYSDFLLISVFLISALTIGFASSFLQAQKTLRLIWTYFETLEVEKKYENTIPVEAFIDSWLLSIYGRTFPITNYFNNKYVLKDDSNKKYAIKYNNKNFFLQIYLFIKKLGSDILYLLLKLITIITKHGLPIFAQIIIAREILNIKNSCSVGFLDKFPFLFYFAVLFWICSVITLVIMIIAEIEYTFIVRKKTNKIDNSNIVKSFGSYSIPEDWAEVTRWSEGNKYFYSHKSIGNTTTSNISIQMGRQPYRYPEHMIFRINFERMLIAEANGEYEVHTSQGLTKHGYIVYVFKISYEKPLNVSRLNPYGDPLMTTIYYTIMGEKKYTLVQATDFRDGKITNVEEVAEFIVNSFVWAPEYEKEISDWL